MIMNIQSHEKVKKKKHIIILIKKSRSSVAKNFMNPLYIIYI